MFLKKNVIGFLIQRSHGVEVLSKENHHADVSYGSIHSMYATCGAKTSGPHFFGGWCGGARGRRQPLVSDVSSVLFVISLLGCNFFV